MKNYLFKHNVLLLLSALILSHILSFNPASTANFLFDGENNLKPNDNVILFGRVVDKDTNEPIAGANITLIDYENLKEFGSATDIFGNYLIKDISS